MLRISLQLTTVHSNLWVGKVLGRVKPDPTVQAKKEAKKTPKLAVYELRPRKRANAVLVTITKTVSRAQGLTFPLVNHSSNSPEECRVFLLQTSL